MLGTTVLYTRGRGCRALAESLGEARPVAGDLRRACIDSRAGLLVARRLTSFDLVSSAVPHGFDGEGAEGVVAAVGGGPNSLLAGLVAARLSETLGIPGSLVSASPSPDDDADAESVLAEVAPAAANLSPKVVRAESARNLVDGMPEGALLVVGAPGGSWLQRQFFGPGRRLVVGAPAGAIVVRQAPRRCFQDMDEPGGFGPGMPAAEALRLMTGETAAVLEDGVLVGIVRRERLEGAGTVGAAMEEPIFVSEDDEAAAADDAGPRVNPVPVVDRSGKLRGLIHL